MVQALTVLLPNCFSLDARYDASIDDPVSKSCLISHVAEVGAADIIVC